MNKRVAKRAAAVASFAILGSVRTFVEQLVGVFVLVKCVCLGCGFYRQVWAMHVENVDEELASWKGCVLVRCQDGGFWLHVMF